MAEIKVPVGVDVEGEGEVKSLASSLDKLETKFKALQSSAQKLSSGKLQSFNKELGGVAKSATGTSGALSFLGGMSPGTFGLLTAGAAGAGMAVSSLISTVGSLITSLVQMGAQGAVAFGKFALQSGMFREDTLATLGVLLKSKTVAKDVYDSAVRFASVTPFNTQEVVAGYKQLLAVGFKTSELESTFRSIGDFAAATGDPTALSRVVTVFGQIRASGRLLANDMNQLTSLGLDRTKVYTEIGKLLGKSAKEAQDLAGKGKVDAETALKAIMASMNNQFGGMMEEKSKTMSGLLSTLVSKPFELMNKAFENSGGVTSFYDSIKGIIKEVNDALFDSKGNATKFGGDIIDMVDSLSNVLKEVTGVGKEFFLGFFEGLAKNRGGLDSFKNAAGELDLKKLGEEAHEFGKNVATIADATAKLSSAFLKLSENEAVVWGVGAAFTVIGGAINQTVQLAMLMAYPFFQAAAAADWLLSKVRELTGATSALSSSLSGMAMGGGGGMAISPFSSAMASPSDSRVLPAMTSSTSGGSAAGSASVGNGGTTNYNSVSAVVSGGMFPEEIAALVRQTVKTELEKL